MIADIIVRLKITLDDVEPKIIRRVEAPLAIRLDRLHLTLQAALGCTNSHLYEIRAGDAGWGIPGPDWGGGPLDARKAKLVDVLEDLASRRCGIFTTSAMAGSTRSGSSASSIPSPAPSIRA